MQCIVQQEPQIFQMHFSTNTQGEFIPKVPFQLKGVKDEEIQFLLSCSYELWKGLQNAQLCCNRGLDQEFHN